MDRIRAEVSRGPRPDDVFGFAAGDLEVQLQPEAIQWQVPKLAQLPHLIGEGAQV